MHTTILMIRFLEHPGYVLHTQTLYPGFRSLDKLLPRISPITDFLATWEHMKQTVITTLTYYHFTKLMGQTC